MSQERSADSMPKVSTPCFCADHQAPLCEHCAAVPVMAGAHAEGLERLAGRDLIAPPSEGPGMPSATRQQQPERGTEDMTIWVYLVDGGLRRVEKRPCQLAGHQEPPFTLKRPDGAWITVFEVEREVGHG